MCHLSLDLHIMFACGWLHQIYMFFLKKSDMLDMHVVESLFLGGPFWEKDSVSSIRGIYVSKFLFILS